MEIAEKLRKLYFNINLDNRVANNQNGSSKIIKYPYQWSQAVATKVMKISIIVNSPRHKWRLSLGDSINNTLHRKWQEKNKC